MTTNLLYAGILAILLGVVHSILGEVLVFRKLRNADDNSWITGSRELPIRSIRILWASWHLVTVFGIAVGVILLKISQTTHDHVALVGSIETTIMIAVFLAGLVVFIGTRGKHPGWLVLFIISMLVWLA